jgi:hypothetical protein
MWALVRRGKKMAGGALVYPEFYQEETTGGAYYGAQLLNTALQAFAELVGRILEGTADLGADAEGVGVRVVEICELC